MNPEENSAQAILSKAYKNKNFGKIFQKSGYGNKNFKFSNVPLLNKSQLIIDQKKSKSFSSLLCVPKNQVTRIHKTSGTSTRPLLIYLTEKDLQTTVEIGSKTFLKAGLNENDVIVHCLNFNMWSGGVTDYLSLEKTGATCIPFGSGNTEALINLINTSLSKQDLRLVVLQIIYLKFMKNVKR